MVASYGYNDSFFLPITSRKGGADILLTITSQGVKRADFQRHVEANRSVLLLLGRAISYIGRQKFKLFYNSALPVNISPKALQVLKAVAEKDMNLKQVATHLSLSRDTVNQHIRAVRHALDAKTNTGAIYQAVKRKLI